MTMMNEKIDSIGVPFLYLLVFACCIKGGGTMDSFFFEPRLTPPSQRLPGSQWKRFVAHVANPTTLHRKHRSSLYLHAASSRVRGPPTILAPSGPQSHLAAESHYRSVAFLLTQKVLSIFSKLLRKLYTGWAHVAGWVGRRRKLGRPTVAASGA